MSYFHALILGVVQSLTEFLPVSSSGHLALFQSGAAGDPASLLAFDVALHVGTLGSIFFFFRREFKNMLHALTPQHPEAHAEQRRVGFILLATIPTGVIGLLLKKHVESAVATIEPVGFGFLATALFLLAGTVAFRWARRSFNEIAWWHVLILGAAQGLAVWPGLSRSGSTIAVALLLGWRWEEAGRFSFLMAVPALLGATLLTAKDMGSLDWGPVALGVAVSFAMGCLALSLLMKFLATQRLWPFSIYCFLLSFYTFFFY